MKGPLLVVLLVLCVLGSAPRRTHGELCRAWNDRMDSLVRAFQCPKRLDSADAKFCCGTCRSPYCCSSGEARLDQEQCALIALQKARATTVPPHPTTISGAGKTETSLVSVGIWASLSAVAVLACHCVCFSSDILNCLKSRSWRRTRNVEEEPPVQLENLRPSRRPRTRAVSFDLTPSYDSDPPPPYSAVDPQSSWSTRVPRSSEESPQEEGAAELPSGSLPSRRVPNSSSVTHSEIETIV